MTPTRRTLKKLRDEGWLAAIVEHWNSWARIRQDLFGFVDIVAIRPGDSVLFVQTTSGSNVSARIDKIRSLESYNTCKLAGIRVEVWGWAKRGPRGQRKTWSARIVEL